MSTYLFGNIKISHHAINWYRLRAKKKKSDSEIKEMIINDLKKTMLRSIVNNEEKYALMN